MAKTSLGLFAGMFFVLVASGYLTSEQWRWKLSSYGPAAERGTPIKLSWSIPADGIPIAGSSASNNLMATLTAKFGPAKPREMLCFMFNRMGSVSGLDFVEVPDDGAPADSGLPGVSGKRGDVRVVGRDIGGPAGMCNMADAGKSCLVQMNTGTRSAGWNQGDWINVTMHEIGHAVGLAHQRVFENATNPGPNLNATIIGLCNGNGPQFDDVYALHRLYGDKYERNGGNNTLAKATNLGRIGPENKSLGTDGGTLLLGPTATDFLSIDGTNDVDCFRFTLSTAGLLSVEVTPQGPDYGFSNEDGGKRVNFSARCQSDLRFELLGAKGTFLQQVNRSGLGQSKSFTATVPGGEYYLRIWGTEDHCQLYRLDLSARPLRGAKSTESSITRSRMGL